MNRTERRAAEHQSQKQTESNSTISEAQLNANRANAQHSTGAKTETGKMASSQNRTSHGLARHNGRFEILHTEEESDFETLKQALSDEHQPTTPTECFLINAMAESIWLSDRAQRLLGSCCELSCGQIAHPKAFALYLRYYTTHSRAFHKSLDAFLKLRAEKRKAEIGFEAQKRKEEELRMKTEQHEIKMKNLSWDALRKDAQACHQLALNTIQQVKAAAEDPGFVAQYAAELAKHGIQQQDIGSSQAA